MQVPVIIKLPTKIDSWYVNSGTGYSFQLAVIFTLGRQHCILITALYLYSLPMRSFKFTIYIGYGHKQTSNKHTNTHAQCRHTRSGLPQFKYQRVHIALHVPLEFELGFDKPFITVAIQLVGTFYMTQRTHSETIQALSVITQKKSTEL